MRFTQSELELIYQYAMPGGKDGNPDRIAGCPAGGERAADKSHCGEYH